MAARAAIRDVGRVLNVPLPDVDRLAKLVPQVVNITLDRALTESRELKDLYDHEDWAKHIIDNAQRLEGICRNASTHAAAVVIGSEPLANIVPLQRSTAGDGTAVTQYDMNGVSQIGLLKIDLLGLSNLTVIAEAAEMVRAHRGIDLDIDQLPLDDAKTYELLGKADTHGIFQLEATFAKRILIDMQPKSPRGHRASRWRSTVRVRSRAAPPQRGCGASAARSRSRTCSPSSSRSSRRRTGRSSTRTR